MKIVAINGSGTGAAGTTGQTLDGVVQGLLESGAEVEMFLLNELKISPCTGCGTCKRTGHCVFKDDYPKIKDAMLGADGVVFSSPNYISNVSSQIKALLDRSFCFLFHCQAMNGKYGCTQLDSGLLLSFPSMKFRRKISILVGNTCLISMTMIPP